MLTKRNKVERMTIVNTLLTSIYDELLKGETDDIDGLLQIAVYAQVEMNRIVFELNQLNGCEPNCSENPNNCEDEPTWEQVKEYCNKRCLDIVDSALRKQWYKDEPQTDDKHAVCTGCDYYDLPNAFHPCASCVDFSKYKPKIETEPQTDCPWK